jgi:hypothetical protein
MVPRADSDELGFLLTQMTFDDELATRAETAELVLVKARKLIEQREARLPAYVSGIPPTDFAVGPYPLRSDDSPAQRKPIST